MSKENKWSTELWMVTITPLRANLCFGEINRGSSRVRYSKDVESIR